MERTHRGLTDDGYGNPPNVTELSETKRKGWPPISPGLGKPAHKIKCDTHATVQLTGPW